MEENKKFFLSKIAYQSSVIEVVLSCIGQGLVLYDCNLNIILHNEKYLSLYNMPWEIDFVGQNMLDMLAKRAVHGIYTEEQYNSYLALVYKSLSSGEPSRIVCELNDKRVIEVLASPLDDGGWLCTHQDISANYWAQKTIEQAARTDELTGLYNRRILNDACQLALDQSSSNCGSALMLLDLDAFKQLNDVYGHFEADLVLKQFAERLRKVKRKTDTAIRLGGDEFSIVMPKIGLLSDVEGAAFETMNRLGEEYYIDSSSVFVGCSIGVSYTEDPKTDIKAMLKEADRALYVSKNSGDGSIFIAKFGSQGAKLVRAGINNSAIHFAPPSSLPLHSDFSVRGSQI